MTSVVFCYAPADSATAREIGEFLERNLPLKAFYEEGLLRADYDLIDAAARGLSAEIAIIVLSPDAVPKQWDRARWEPVFLEQPRETDACAIFALSRDCKFPALLRRQAFADLSTDRKRGLREIKRLILKRRAPVRNTFDLPPLAGTATEEAIDQLGASIADQPGIAVDVPRETALAFAHASKDEFEGAFWIDCADRTVAGVLGDTGHSLALPLSGSPEQNIATLRAFVEERRCLFLYEHLLPHDPAFVDFGGRASVVAVSPSPVRERLNVEQIGKLFARWTQRLPECLTRLGDAWHYLHSGDLHFAPALLALLKNQERLAEADELLDLLIDDALACDDQESLARYRWDRSWIWGHWGEPYSAAVVPQETARSASQIGFDFG